MDALGAEVACHRFGEDALGGLGRREAGKVGASAQGRRVAGRDDRSRAAFDHGRRQPPREVKQAIVLTWKFLLRTLGSMSWKLPHAPPTALCTRTDGAPMSRCTAASEASICGFIRDVAGVGLGVLDIALQQRQALAIAREHGDGITAGG